MRVVVDGTPTESVKVVVTALQRTIFRQLAEVPLANQSCAVACLFEERRQRRFAREASRPGASREAPPVRWEAGTDNVP
jgi:hypothetical protein